MRKNEEDIFVKQKNKKFGKGKVLAIVIIAGIIAIGMIEVKVHWNSSNEMEASATIADDVIESVTEPDDVKEVESLIESFCGSKSAFESGSYVEDVWKNEEEFGMLIPIPDYKYLYYAKGTGIVYIMQATRSSYVGYGFLAPFYSKNGNLYRYEDGFFKELQGNVGGAR